MTLDADNAMGEFPHCKWEELSDKSRRWVLGLLEVEWARCRRDLAEVESRIEGAVYADASRDAIQGQLMDMAQTKIFIAALKAAVDALQVPENTEVPEAKPS